MTQYFCTICLSTSVTYKLKNYPLQNPGAAVCHYLVEFWESLISLCLWKEFVLWNSDFLCHFRSWKWEWIIPKVKMSVPYGRLISQQKNYNSEKVYVPLKEVIFGYLFPLYKFSSGNYKVFMLWQRAKLPGLIFIILSSRTRVFIMFVYQGQINSPI